MEFLTKLFKEDEKQVIGLCRFKKDEEIRFFIPKMKPSALEFNAQYEKNFFLL